MQAFLLQSGEALVIRSGIQSEKISQAACSSEKNQTLVASQPPRKIYQNRSEDCQVQQIYHVSDDCGVDRQKVVCRDIVSD